MRLCSIASSSSGNCIYVGTDKTNIIIDAGISGKRVEHGLNGIGLKTNEIHGILITHEHSDHIKGLGVLARRYEIPIYANAKTAEEILRIKSLGEIPRDLFRIISSDQSFEINDLKIQPFSTSHDAIDPMCYTIYGDNKKIGFATDLGTYNDYIVEQLSSSDLIFLEANHDINMLQVGPYPYYLKQRILGDRGHLSNERSGRLLCELLHSRLAHIVLGHLSKENNYEALAYETIQLELKQQQLFKVNDFNIQVAKREETSDLISV